MNLTIRILIGMVAGLVVGVVLQWVDMPKDHFISTFLTYGLIDAGGDIFITLLKMMVVPLVLVLDLGCSKSRPISFLASSS